jgi:hypothetical protein
MRCYVPRTDSCAATKTSAWPLPLAREAHVALLPTLPAEPAEIHFNDGDQYDDDQEILRNERSDDNIDVAHRR